MSSNQVPGYNRVIVVDTANIELEASWAPELPQPPLWARLKLWFVTRAHHQSAILAYAAIIAVLWISGVRAQHPVSLAIALASIVVVAITTECIGNRHYGSSRSEREA